VPQVAEEAGARGKRPVCREEAGVPVQRPVRRGQ
jgi:hypothetical protein